MNPNGGHGGGLPPSEPSQAAIPPPTQGGGAEDLWESSLSRVTGWVAFEMEALIWGVRVAVETAQLTQPSGKLWKTHRGGVSPLLVPQGPPQDGPP